MILKLFRPKNKTMAEFLGLKKNDKLPMVVLPDKAEQIFKPRLTAGIFLNTQRS